MLVTRLILAGLFLAIIGVAGVTFGMLGRTEIDADANSLDVALKHAQAESIISTTSSDTFTLTVRGGAWSGESVPFVGYAKGREPLGYAVNGATETMIVSTFALGYENGRFMGASAAGQPVLACNTAPPAGATYNTLTLYVASAHVTVSC